MRMFEAKWREVWRTGWTGRMFGGRKGLVSGSTNITSTEDKHAGRTYRHDGNKGMAKGGGGGGEVCRMRLNAQEAEWAGQ